MFEKHKSVFSALASVWGVKPCFLLQFWHLSQPSFLVVDFTTNGTTLTILFTCSPGTTFIHAIHTIDGCPTGQMLRASLTVDWLIGFVDTMHWHVAMHHQLHLRRHYVLEGVKPVSWELCEETVPDHRLLVARKKGSAKRENDQHSSICRWRFCWAWSRQASVGSYATPETHWPHYVIFLYCTFNIFINILTYSICTFDLYSILSSLPWAIQIETHLGHRGWYRKKKHETVAFIRVRWPEMSADPWIRWTRTAAVSHHLGRSLPLERSVEWQMETQFKPVLNVFKCFC